MSASIAIVLCMACGIASAHVVGGVNLATVSITGGVHPFVAPDMRYRAYVTGDFLTMDVGWRTNSRSAVIVGTKLLAVRYRVSSGWPTSLAARTGWSALPIYAAGVFDLGDTFLPELHPRVSVFALGGARYESGDVYPYALLGVRLKGRVGPMEPAIEVALGTEQLGCGLSIGAGSWGVVP